MKRSEFVAKLHSEEDPWVTSVVELAEAAGCKWDPEEALPKRLALETYGSLDLQHYIQDGDGHRWAFLFGDVGRLEPMMWYEPEARLRIAREAVRRYNAWPELRHLAANLLEECDSAEGIPSALKSFLAILDGKETP